MNRKRNPLEKALDNLTQMKKGTKKKIGDRYLVRKKDGSYTSEPIKSK